MNEVLQELFDELDAEAGYYPRKIPGQLDVQFVHVGKGFSGITRTEQIQQLQKNLWSSQYPGETLTCCECKRNYFFDVRDPFPSQALCPGCLEKKLYELKVKPWEEEWINL